MRSCADRFLRPVCDVSQATYQIQMIIKAVAISFLENAWTECSVNSACGGLTHSPNPSANATVADCRQANAMILRLPATISFARPTPSSAAKSGGHSKLWRSPETFASECQPTELSYQLSSIDVDSQTGREQQRLDMYICALQRAFVPKPFPDPWSFPCPALLFQMWLALPPCPRACRQPR